MPMTPLKYASLSFFAFGLLSTLPASAQQAGGGNGASSSFMPSMSSGNSTSGGDDNGGWNADNANRKDLREEMEQIRKEHEELEAAREQLRAKCGPMQTPPPPPPPQGPSSQSGLAPTPPAQASAECEHEKEALRVQYEQLHERRQAFRVKMDAWREEHSQIQQPFGMGANPPGIQSGGSMSPGPPANVPDTTGSSGVLSFGPAPDR